MGKLRKEWDDSKKTAKFLFEQETKKTATVDITAEGAGYKPWPFKWAKNLGPNLDKLEGAKTTKDRQKYGALCVGATTSYRADINGQKGDLDKINKSICSFLVDALNKVTKGIENEMKKG